MLLLVVVGPVQRRQPPNPMQPWGRKMDGSRGQSRPYRNASSREALPTSAVAAAAVLCLVAFAASVGLSGATGNAGHGRHDPGAGVTVGNSACPRVCGNEGMYGK